MTLDREIYEEVGIYVNNHTYFSVKVGLFHIL